MMFLNFIVLLYEVEFGSYIEITFLKVFIGVVPNKFPHTALLKVKTKITIITCKPRVILVGLWSLALMLW